MTPAQEALVLAAWRAGDEGVEVRGAVLRTANALACGICGWVKGYGLYGANQSYRFVLTKDERALMDLAAKAGEGRP
jgi:hypothetical protein